MKPRIEKYAMCLACCLLLLAAGLVGCPVPLKSAQMTMVLQGGLAADVKQGDDSEVPRDTIAAVLVVVDQVQLRQADGAMVTVFTGPFEVDILSLQGIGAVMAKVDVPAGSYTGGVLTLSSAEVEFTDNIGTWRPLVLPDAGQYSFEQAFSVAPDSLGVLKLHLDDIEVFVTGTDSLSFSANVEVEAETGDPEQEIGHVDAEGVISNLDLETMTFELQLNDGGVLGVDFAQTTVYVPESKAKCGVEGTVADLANAACASVSGDLALKDAQLWITADTVTISAYNCVE